MAVTCPSNICGAYVGYCFLFVCFPFVIGDNTGHDTLAPVLLTESFGGYMAVTCPANICGGYCFLFVCFPFVIGDNTGLYGSDVSC